MKCSILFLTYERTELSKRILSTNLLRSGCQHGQDYELLICDQGTDDENHIEWLKSVGASYLRLNQFNEGVARSLNQLIIRSKGPHVFFMPNDVLLPENWLATALEYAEDIPNSGIVGFEGQDLIHPEHLVEGASGKKYVIRSNLDKEVLEGMQIFGPILITQQLLLTIGGFCESYHPYGFEDSDLCFRAQRAGLLSYYIPGMRYAHEGIGADENPFGYRDVKNFSIVSNRGLHRWRAANYDRIGIYEPFPVIKKPMI